MRICLLPIAVAALAVAGCKDSAPPAPEETATPVAVEQQVELSGPSIQVLAFGDSLFAGYGLGEGESYPAQLQEALRAKGINATITNAGVSGDTTGAGRQRLAFTLDNLEVKPDLVLLELGGNDMLRGLAVSEVRANFAAMLVELRTREIPVLLMGMRAPPNYGPEYQQAFDAMYPELAREYGAALVPFWLESIYQSPTLFQSDRIHPTEPGIDALVAATIDEIEAALPEPAV